MDAAQDTFVDLVQRERALTDRAPSSLLYTMATNICLNRLRARRRRPEESDTPLIETIARADDAHERIDARDLVDRLFARDRASTRVLAVCHFVDGMTLAETAEISGMSVSGVRKRLRRLRALGLALREDER